MGQSVEQHAGYNDQNTERTEERNSYDSAAPTMRDAVILTRLLGIRYL
jgi:hypothetical protein